MLENKRLIILVAQDVEGCKLYQVTGIGTKSGQYCEYTVHGDVSLCCKVIRSGHPSVAGDVRLATDEDKVTAHKTVAVVELDANGQVVIRVEAASWQHG